jgi:sortase A
MKKHLSTIFLFLILVVGLSLLLYPTFSDWWNDMHSSHAIADYDSVMSEMTPDDYSHLFDAAVVYNEKLRKVNYPLMYYDQVEGYHDLLDITGTGIMGYIDIPKIHCQLPIYHGTDEAVLQVAVGHLPGSSLPVGGETTHCVISSHRGLPSARLFTDLDQLVEGDTFVIRVLNETLTYEVDQIRIVLPNDLSALQLEQGLDLCTLVTCTPYGINTHRLLVRGARIETAEEKPIIYVSNEAYRIEPLLVTPAVAAPMLLVMLIHLMIKYREPPKAKKEDVGDPTLERKIRKENDK